MQIKPDNVCAHGESSGADGLLCLSDGRLMLPFNRYFGATPREEKSWNEDLYGERMTVVHGQGVLGDRSVVEKTSGMDWDALAESFGFEPIPGSPKLLGSNRVHVVPIAWLYA